MKDNKKDINLEQTLTNFVDKHVRYIKYISYGLGLAGLVIIGRSIHITARFRNVKDIPTHFIQRGIRVNLTTRTCDAGGRLYSEHVPLLELKKIKQQTDLLVVHLAGVEHTDQSVTWLQNNVINRTIRCDILKARNDMDLDCVVYFKMGWVRRHCLNQYLIEQGLALVSLDADMGDHVRAASLIERLVMAELRAEKKGRGVWQRPSLRERIRGYPEHMKRRLHLSTVATLTDWLHKLKEVGSRLVTKIKRK